MKYTVPMLEAVISNNIDQFEQESIVRECQKKAKKQRKKDRERKQCRLEHYMGNEPDVLYDAYVEDDRPY